MSIQVKFTNGSDEVFDPALTTVSMSSGETEGDQIFQDGLDAPSNKLLPGKAVKWEAATPVSPYESKHAHPRSWRFAPAFLVH